MFSQYTSLPQSQKKLYPRDGQFRMRKPNNSFQWRTNTKGKFRFPIVLAVDNRVDYISRVIRKYRRGKERKRKFSGHTEGWRVGKTKEKVACSGSRRCEIIGSNAAIGK